MIYYEYDADGWLVGWHEDAERSNSTATSYDPIPAVRARWVTGAWTEDASRETAQAAAISQAEAIKAVQARLDSHAQSWGYDNIFTACTYAEEPEVPQFQAEGQALRAWRSATWAVCYEHADAPSLDALLAFLPAPPARP